MTDNAAHWVRVARETRGDPTMRLETATIAQAFAAGRAARTARTARTRTDGHNVWLHDNLIATRTTGGNCILTAAGWATRTTVERLNGISRTLNLGARFDLRGGLHVTIDGERMPLGSRETVTL